MDVFEKTKNNLINVINNLIEKKLDQNNILQNVINNINNNFDIFTDNNKLIEEKIKFIIIFISFFEKYPFLSDCFENNIFSSHIYQYFIKIYLDLNIENEEYLNSLFSLLLLFRKYFNIENEDLKFYYNFISNLLIEENDDYNKYNYILRLMNVFKLLFVPNESSNINNKGYINYLNSDSISIYNNLNIYEKFKVNCDGLTLVIKFNIEYIKIFEKKVKILEIVFNNENNKNFIIEINKDLEILINDEIFYKYEINNNNYDITIFFSLFLSENVQNYFNFFTFNDQIKKTEIKDENIIKYLLKEKNNVIKYIKIFDNNFMGKIYNIFGGFYGIKNNFIEYVKILYDKQKSNEEIVNIIINNLNDEYNLILKEKNNSNTIENNNDIKFILKQNFFELNNKLLYLNKNNENYNITNDYYGNFLLNLNFIFFHNLNNNKQLDINNLGGSQNFIPIFDIIFNYLYNNENNETQNNQIIENLFDILNKISISKDNIINMYKNKIFETLSVYLIKLKSFYFTEKFIKTYVLMIDNIIKIDNEKIIKIIIKNLYTNINILNVIDKNLHNLFWEKIQEKILNLIDYINLTNIILFYDKFETNVLDNKIIENFYNLWVYKNIEDEDIEYIIKKIFKIIIKSEKKNKISDFLLKNILIFLLKNSKFQPNINPIINKNINENFEILNKKILNCNNLEIKLIFDQILLFHFFTYINEYKKDNRLESLYSIIRIYFNIDIKLIGNNKDLYIKSFLTIFNFIYDYIKNHKIDSLIIIFIQKVLIILLDNISNFEENEIFKFIFLNFLTNKDNCDNYMLIDKNLSIIISKKLIISNFDLSQLFNEVLKSDLTFNLYNNENYINFNYNLIILYDNILEKNKTSEEIKNDIKKLMIKSNYYYIEKVSKFEFDKLENILIKNLLKYEKVNNYSLMDLNNLIFYKLSHNLIKDNSNINEFDKFFEKNINFLTFLNSMCNFYQKFSKDIKKNLILALKLINELLLNNKLIEEKIKDKLLTYGFVLINALIKKNEKVFEEFYIPTINKINKNEKEIINFIIQINIIEKDKNNNINSENFFHEINNKEDVEKMEELQNILNNLLKYEKYIKIKNYLFSFSNFFNINPEQLNNSYLKYKFKNYYTKNFNRILLKPILNINNYIENYSLSNENFFNDEEDDNLNNNEENKLIFNKENYDLFLSDKQTNLEYLQNNFNFIQSSFKAYCCLIKQNNIHIKGFMFIDYKNHIIFIPLNQEKSFCCNKENKQICYGNPHDIFLENNIKNIKNFKIKHINYLFKKIYYYKKSGIEIFLKNGKNFYFNFFYEYEVNELIKEINKIVNLNLIKNDFIDDNIIGYYNFKYFYDSIFKNINFNQSSNSLINLTNLIESNNKDKTLNLSLITDLWENNNLSNFSFIMILNIFSNRSFNDITQYPIFPLLFYKLLKEKNLKKFERDISKTIEFLNLNELDNYSSEGNNLNLYSKPYSSGRLIYKNMKYIFPYSFELFYIEEELENNENNEFESNNIEEYLDKEVNKFNELIPDDFNLPEKEINLNKLKYFDEKKIIFGKNIYENRENLENKNISNNLNKWIDLIFGYLQNYKTSNQIKNKYGDECYLNNEEKNKSNIKNEIIMELVEITGFVPLQLFNNPLKKRKIENINLTTIFNGKISLNEFNDFEFNTINNFFYIDIIEEENSFLLINNEKYFSFTKTKLFNYKIKSEKNIFFYRNYYNFEINNKNDNINITSNYLNQNHICSSSNGKNIFIAGQNNGYITYINENNYIIIKNLFLPLITSLFLIEGETNYLICGSYLGYLYIFKLNININDNFSSNISNNEKLLILYKIYLNSTDIITSIYFDYELNILGTSSNDGFINLYLFNEGKLTKYNFIKSKESVNFIFIYNSQLPSFLTYSYESKKLISYTINCNKIYQIEEKTFLNPKVYYDKVKNGFLLYLNDLRQIKIISIPFLYQTHAILIKSFDIGLFEISNNKNYVIICSKDGKKISVISYN